MFLAFYHNSVLYRESSVVRVRILSKNIHQRSLFKPQVYALACDTMISAVTAVQFFNNEQTWSVSGNEKLPKMTHERETRLKMEAILFMGGWWDLTSLPHTDVEK